MLKHWVLIVADYRREYDLSLDEVETLDVDEFLWLLRGLSPQARFMKAWRDAPRNVYTDADIAAVHDN